MVFLPEVFIGISQYFPSTLRHFNLPPSPGGEVLFMCTVLMVLEVVLVVLKVVLQLLLLQLLLLQLLPLQLPREGAPHKEVLVRAPFQ